MKIKTKYIYTVRDAKKLKILERIKPKPNDVEFLICEDDAGYLFSIVPEYIDILPNTKEVEKVAKQIKNLEEKLKILKTKLEDCWFKRNGVLDD